MKRDKRTLILTTLVCLLPMLIGALVYDRLPETMVTHWNVSGEPDGFSSRAFAVFGLPALIAGINLLLYFALNADPKRGNMSSALVGITRWICPVVSVLAGGLTLAWGLGYELRIERIVPIFVGLMFIIVGNYLPKTKQSYTMGIKLPWTLASEENWNRTHRLAGFLWVIGGILLILLTLLRFWNTWTFLLVVIPMSVVPMIYSYLLYRKGI